MTVSRTIRPELDKFIAQMAPKLPERSRIRMDITYITGAELKLTGFKDYKGKPLVDDTVYELDVPVEKVHNHKFRMRLAFLRYGMQGVYEYLENYLKPDSLLLFKQRFMSADA